MSGPVTRYALNLTFYEMAAVNIAIADRLKNFEEKLVDPAFRIGRQFYEEEIGYMKSALEQARAMKLEKLDTQNSTKGN